jgi:acyl dehydratase
VGTYEDLEEGERFESPSRKVDETLMRQLIQLGGYTHPLFTKPEFAKTTPLGRTPLPGEAVLLIMGGLLEQSGRFDETTIALVGFDEVHFKAPAFAGDEIRVLATVLSKKVSSSGAKGLVTFSWECLNSQGETLVETKAKMLFSLRGRDSQKLPE